MNPLPSRGKELWSRHLDLRVGVLVLGVVRVHLKRIPKEKKFYRGMESGLWYFENLLLYVF